MSSLAYHCAVTSSWGRCLHGDDPPCSRGVCWCFGEDDDVALLLLLLIEITRTHTRRYRMKNTATRPNWGPIETNRNGHTHIHTQTTTLATQRRTNRHTLTVVQISATTSTSGTETGERGRDLGLNPLKPECQRERPNRRHDDAERRGRKHVMDSGARSAVAAVRAFSNDPRPLVRVVIHVDANTLFLCIFELYSVSVYKSRTQTRSAASRVRGRERGFVGRAFGSALD